MPPPAIEAPAQNAAASFRRPLAFNRRHPIPDTRTHRPLASYAFSRRRLSKSFAAGDLPHQGRYGKYLNDKHNYGCSNAKPEELPPEATQP